jgi:hypothetical protein
LIRYEEVRMFNVRWNAGVHNYMTYVATNFTTGRYDPTRLANLGIGHNAIDAGGRPQGGDDAGDAQAAPANRLSSTANQSAREGDAHSTNTLISTRRLVRRNVSLRLAVAPAASA